MAIEITVPELGESVLEATVSRWLKKEGDGVKQGEPLVELETDKVNLEVSARQSGTLAHIDRQEGEDVKVGDVLGEIDPTGQPAEKQPVPEAEQPAGAQAAPKPEQQTGQQPQKPDQEGAGAREQREAAELPMPEVTPVARRMAEEQSIDLRQVKGSGPNGRITKGDVESYLQNRPSAQTLASTAPQTAPAWQPPPAEQQPGAGERPPEITPAPSPAIPPYQPAGQAAVTSSDGRPEERIKMTRRRRTIAKRLLEAQQTAAILTTFNEIDMTAVMDLRRRRNEEFQKRYGVKIGYTSFFVKASIGALKAFPQLNGEIQGDDMILKYYYDIGVAVGSPEGLVVPVLRNAERMSFAEIEKKVEEFVQKTQDNTLSLEDLRGGTFTITNGGVFGSLMSTPILTPPQVGILGLHKIEKRPVVVNDEITIRPMMYVALSYDHRMVDGREAVQFLVRIKQLIEDPETLLIEG